MLSQPLSVALSFFDIADTLGSAHNRDHHTLFHYHIVHRNKERRPLGRIKFTFRCMKEAVVRIVAPARSITTLPFVFLSRYFR